MNKDAWNVYRGRYCVQPAARQKTAPMAGNPHNPAMYPVTSPPNHLAATNEIAIKNRTLKLPNIDNKWKELSWAEIFS